MAHYEERLERDLRAIHDQVARTGRSVEQAVRQACRALLTRDEELATETILGDVAINDEARELDRLCHVFVARHLPSAGHLRYISSVLRLSIALERIGDYAETISRTAIQLSEDPPATIASDIQLMADQACSLLRQSLDAFHWKKPDLARGTLELARKFVATSDKVFVDLLAEGEKRSRPLNDTFILLATFNRLERIIHQAKNICEETIFAATGETKPPKRFDILFVDERNDGASQVAEHLARKAYPESGRYASAGWKPAERIDPAYARSAEGHGIDLSHARPESLREKMADHLSHFDLIVGLENDGRRHIEKLPFHSLFQQWHIDASRGPEEVHRQIATNLSELMEKLRGRRVTR